jgi:hypothetical protein
MQQGGHRKKVIASANVREFFRDSVGEALDNQKLEADDHTVHYVVNILTRFTRSERLYDNTPDGRQLRPLALMLADALEARSERQRHESLRRLGDVSLFIAGFFSHTLARRLVDVDYYVAMGGNAYSSLYDRARETSSGRAFSGIYGELARKFQGFVDVLWEVSENVQHSTDRDILRLYDLWTKTGSRRAATLLRKLGIYPINNSTTSLGH